MQCDHVAVLRMAVLQRHRVDHLEAPLWEIEGIEARDIHVLGLQAPFDGASQLALPAYPSSFVTEKFNSFIRINATYIYCQPTVRRQQVFTPSCWSLVAFFMMNQSKRSDAGGGGLHAKVAATAEEKR